eukprot:37331-Pyramimonas_sp.AAC.2
MSRQRHWLDSTIDDTRIISACWKFCIACAGHTVRSGADGQSECFNFGPRLGRDPSHASARALVAAIDWHAQTSTWPLLTLGLS